MLVVGTPIQPGAFMYLCRTMLIVESPREAVKVFY